MTLSYTGDFIPDNSATVSIDSFGIPIYFRVLDDDGNPVNLTSTASVEIELKHTENNTISKITRLAVKSNPNDGIGYYILKPGDVSVVGQYTCKPILNYAADTNFTDGRKIKSFSTMPNVIEFVE